MKISIVGVGHVGATLAYTLLLKGLGTEIVLVNRTKNRAEAEVADLQHASSFAARPLKFRAGEMADTAGSDLVILTMSVAATPGEVSRDQLAGGNVEIFRHWIPLLAQASPLAIFLVITNPVDLMTYVTLKLSGLPANQVIGTGTLIDSGRFRNLLSNHLQIHPDDIRAYILGEHGETQFPVLSMAMTGGLKIDQDPMQQQLFERTRVAGEYVFRIKGFTNYAIAMASSLIVEAIVEDSRRTLPVSILMDGYQGEYDVCLSVPAIIGRRGVLRQLRPVLNEQESQQFRYSASKVRSVIEAMSDRLK